MAPTLHATDFSGAVRSVYMCAEAIGLKLNLKKVDLLGAELHKPEYLKINPQHTVPLLDDDGFILADSHAIMTYLVSKYGTDDSLYPKDLQQRAVVDHRLHFDSNVLFPRGFVISVGILLGHTKNIDPKAKTALEEAYTITETFLEKNPYVAGKHLTVADFSFITSINSWINLVPLSEEKFPKILAWIKRMEQLPYYKKANQSGLDQYAVYLKERLSK